MKRKDTHALIAIFFGTVEFYINAPEVDNGGRRQVKIIIMPAIHVAGEATKLLEKPNGSGILDPTPSRNDFISS